MHEIPAGIETLERHSAWANRMLAALLVVAFVLSGFGEMESAAVQPWILDGWNLQGIAGHLFLHADSLRDDAGQCRGDRSLPTAASLLCLGKELGQDLRFDECKGGIQSTLRVAPPDAAFKACGVADAAEKLIRCHGCEHRCIHAPQVPENPAPRKKRQDGITDPCLLALLTHRIRRLHQQTLTGRI